MVRVRFPRILMAINNVDAAGTRLTWYGWPSQPDLALGERCASEATAVDMMHVPAPK